MAYGSIKANTIIFNSGGGDTSIDLTSLLASGSNFSGSTIQATSFTGVTGVFTTSLSGATITGATGNITTITGASGIFTTSISGASITGTNVNATNITGQTISGATFTATTGNIGNVVTTGTLSGATITGSTANFTSVTGVTGVFTSQVSGNLYKCSGNVTVISGSGDVRPYGLYSFPASVGTANYVLQTNGDGTTSWIVNTPTTSTGLSVSGITSNTNAISSTYYVVLSGLTLTLPSSPAAGDYVGIINRSDTTTGVVARNGSNIMGLAEDMVLNDLNARFRLVYADASNGWVIL
jgi:hypothetical protein